MHKHIFVFIGGTHKSGSTLLTSLLSAAPEVSSFSGTGAPMDEGQWLQDVLSPDVNYGELLFGLSDEPYLNETNCHNYPNAAQRLFKCWSPYWDLRRSHLVEKSPMNVIRTRFLQDIFPVSMFVVTIRDPKKSYMAAKKNMPLISPELYFENWVRIYSTYHREAVNLQKTILVRFESLLSAPDHERCQLNMALRVSMDKWDEQLLKKECDEAYAQAWNEHIDPASEKRCMKLLPRWCENYGYL